MNVLPPAHSKWNNDMSAKFQKAKSISLWSVFNKLIAGPWDFLPMTKTKISNVALKWNNTDIYSRKIFSGGQSKSSYYMVRFLVVNLERPTKQELTDLQKKSQRCYPDFLHFPSMSTLTLLGQFIHLCDFLSVGNIQIHC